MKRLWIAVVVLGGVQAASGSPTCTSGTLASYELLGAGGCSIGGDTIGSFATLSGITGATAIDPAMVEIKPSGGTADPELLFEVDETADANSVLESLFTYTISGTAFTMETITLSGSSETGDGGVTDTQNYCAGGAFGPDGVTGCSGSATGTLLTFDGIQNTDQTSFAGTTLLSITDDFVLDGGTAGSASGGMFLDQFAATSAVPEPNGIFLLAAAGLVFAGIRKLRSFQRNS